VCSCDDYSMVEEVMDRLKGLGYPCKSRIGGSFVGES